MAKAKDRLISTLKSDLDSLLATIETLENKNVMDRLSKSKDDIGGGQIKSAREFLHEQI